MKIERRKRVDLDKKLFEYLINLSTAGDNEKERAVSGLENIINKLNEFELGINSGKIVILGDKDLEIVQKLQVFNMCEKNCISSALEYYFTEKKKDIIHLLSDD